MSDINQVELLEHAAALIDEYVGTRTAQVLENLIEAGDYDELYFQVQNAQASLDQYEREAV